MVVAPTLVASVVLRLLRSVLMGHHSIMYIAITQMRYPQTPTQSTLELEGYSDVGQSGSSVLVLDLGLDTRHYFHPGSPGVLLHHFHHLLVWPEQSTLNLRLTEGDLCGDSSDTGDT